MQKQQKKKTKNQTIKKKKNGDTTKTRKTKKSQNKNKTKNTKPKAHKLQYSTYVSTTNLENRKTRKKVWAGGWVGGRVSLPAAEVP